VGATTVRMRRCWKCPRSGTGRRATAQRAVRWEPTVSTPVRTWAQARSRQLGGGQAFAGRGEHQHGVALSQQALTHGPAAPCVRRDYTGKADHQIGEQLAIVRTRGHERRGDDHPRAGQAHAPLDPLVVRQALFDTLPEASACGHQRLR